MLKNYFKIALRNFLKTKGFSMINIAGLSVGLAVVLIIGLWITDELAFDTSVPQYKKIVQVLQNQTNNGKTETQESNPCILADELRKSYPDDFRFIAQTSWTYDQLLTYEKNHYAKPGTYIQPQFLDIISVKMKAGSRNAIDDPHTILISESLAKTIFGNADPIGKMLRMDNRLDIKVGGVYADLPLNSGFADMQLFISWKLFLQDNSWVNDQNKWGANFTRAFALMKDEKSVAHVSEKIKNIIYDNASEGDKKAKPEVFLHPMSKWHLYNDFENGKNAGGRIKFIWLFGIIGFFVLVLACINFMNLATARSEKRAKEVGIFKTLGSRKIQLIWQFLTESVAMVFISFVLSLLLAHISLPFFNDISQKTLSIPWADISFWLVAALFCLLIGLLAGSYPAFYLSAFKPVKVLKGTLGAGRAAVMPRKVLVVFQFTVSVALLSCTWIVYKQIQFAKDRPAGFHKEGLVTTGFFGGIFRSFEAFQQDLKNSGAVTSVAQSTSPPSTVWRTNGGFNWKGKDPNFSVDFPNNGVSHDYGKTIGWKVVQGRDFSKDIASDSSAMIITTQTLRLMNLENPIGETITWEDVPYHIIGVVDNMIVGSPYSADRACVFHISRQQENVITMRLSAGMSTQAALAKIEKIYKSYAPEVPFSYNFVDATFAQKFGEEERIGKLSSLFTYMAMFISVLGLVGLAAYTTERRTKEIGVRKVLGATMLNICQLIAKEFVVLTLISFLVAVPLSYFFMNNWLQNFEYRASISIWIYLAAGIFTLLLTILVVSYQAIKAAIANPIKSLRTE
jgi:ABC-type antimicrobial peptide transport system permease subunit